MANVDLFDVYRCKEVNKCILQFKLQNLSENCK